MAFVATLLPSRDRLARVQRALRRGADVWPCDDWAALLDCCARRVVTLVLLDLFAVGNVGAEDAFDEVRELRRRFPAMTVVLYTAAPAARGHAFFDAGRLGLDGLVLADVDDDPRRFRATIADAEARGVSQLLRPALMEASPTVRDAISICVSRAFHHIDPEELAKTIGIGRKRLALRLTEAGFPTMQPLIAWGRLIVAARLLEDTDRTADEVARALHYPSGSAFRNASQRYLSASPHEVRSRGGAAYVVAQLLERARRHAQRGNGEQGPGSGDDTAAPPPLR